MENDFSTIPSDFEAIKQIDENGLAYWKSRDLSKLLGYSEYRNFKPVVEKAMEVCRNNANAIEDHFVEYNEMVELGSGAFRTVQNLKLSKYACLLIAMNVNIKKPNALKAQAYFTDKISASELIGDLTSSNIILYKTSNNKVKIEVLFNNETFWLSQKRMAELFGVDNSTVNYHLKQIFETGELEEKSTIGKIPIVQLEGQREITRQVIFYNLDAVIAVGYRVNSYQATQFRIWATNVLKELIIKGFVLDDDRLKQGKFFGRDYFDELLERIREIRASERRYYQKITDIYAQCSIDYDAKAPTTQEFYKKVQNKLHWAITHKTAAEIISERADADKPMMGLMTWKQAPKGKILKSDVSIAKNYLSEDEVSSLNLLATSLLEFAENQARRSIIMTMEEWSTKIDAYLQLSNYEILLDSGSVTAEQAKQKAETAYTKFRNVQDKDWISDFDREIKKLDL
ncbi:MAG: RhuM family protein [Paludibacter sp.]